MAEQGMETQPVKKMVLRAEGLVKKYGITSIFLLPYLTAFIVFFLVPLFYGIYISLTNFQYGKPGLENFNDFMWFKMIFDKSYMPGIYNSFWLSFVHTIMFAVIMSIPKTPDFVSTPESNALAGAGATG